METYIVFLKGVHLFWCKMFFKHVASIQGNLQHSN